MGGPCLIGLPLPLTGNSQIRREGQEDHESGAENEAKREDGFYQGGDHCFSHFSVRRLIHERRNRRERRTL